MTAEDLARRARATKRGEVMVIRKAKLGEPELDFSPVRGAEAVSLATRLTIESFSLSGVANAHSSRDRHHVRFVRRTRA